MNGLIVINKEKNWTSRDVDNVLKGILHEKKIGHVGTLDPNATGVLVCLLGNATKYQDYFCDDKIYLAEIIIGIETTTDDITGEITNVYNGSIDITDEKIINAFQKFIGSIEQLPPMYSAKSINGKRLYTLAREGKIVERKPARVVVYNIEKLNEKAVEEEMKTDYSFIYGKLEESNFHFNKNLTIKKVYVKVSCSKGTYIRSLCRDIGKELNIHACMGNLKRIQASDFKIENAYKLAEIEKMYNEKNYSFVQPCFYLEENTVVTFGKFEAFHRGHKKIFDTMLDIAKKEKLHTAAIVFDFHNENCLTTIDERYNFLWNYGIEKIFRTTFGEEIKNLTREYFIDEIIIKQMKAKYVVVGEDCSFGKNKLGDAQFLKEYAKQRGIEVIIVNKEKINYCGEIKDISTTLIKQIINDGDIHLAEELLERKLKK